MENFIRGQAWALPPVVGRWAEDSLHPGPRELTPYNVTPAGGLLPTCPPACGPLRCPTTHRRREVPLAYPCGRALPQPHGRAGAPGASSLSRLTSELEDQADQGDPSSNAVSQKPEGYRSERALGRPLPADFC